LYSAPASGTSFFAANFFGFQIFPIYESPSQRLRVKLVGLSKIASTSDFKSDVQQLGRTMEYLASELPLKAKLDLKAYDPSLNFLLKWMQSEEPPTMHEVLRHPFFMTPAERLTFGIALGGGSKLGMIGYYLCPNPHDAKSADVDVAFFEAVNKELTAHLETQLRLMFEGTSSKALAAAVVGTGGGGAVAAASSSSSSKQQQQAASSSKQSRASKQSKQRRHGG
jgi:hypothetical protein